MQQVIPLPEASDYQVKIRQKHALVKAQAAGADWPQYTVTDAQGQHHATAPEASPCARNGAGGAGGAGVAPETLAAALPEARYKRIPDEVAALPTEQAFAAAYLRGVLLGAADWPRWAPAELL